MVVFRVLLCTLTLGHMACGMDVEKKEDWDFENNIKKKADYAMSAQKQGQGSYNKESICSYVELAKTIIQSKITNKELQKKDWYKESLPFLIRSLYLAQSFNPLSNLKCHEILPFCNDWLALNGGKKSNATHLVADIAHVSMLCGEKKKLTRL